MSEAKEQHVWLAVDEEGNLNFDWLPFSGKSMPQHKPYQRFRVIPDPLPEEAQPEPEHEIISLCIDCGQKQVVAHSKCPTRPHFHICGDCIRTMVRNNIGKA